MGSYAAVVLQSAMWKKKKVRFLSRAPCAVGIYKKFSPKNFLRRKWFINTSFFMICGIIPKKEGHV